ncbi:kinase-like domain-containing protein [Fomitopsis serialis]|uniref:kinase-like domain-containing protein n=1 Tax=Fomitopsis serialis TaxID=139415 RepID=UPI0020083B8A|nr:kinase-like domain-containing protein [Neoantrodia serialis]XP_047896626.1 kinase-like domain-containing protein [Neoantrodia serialis]KAH9912037.1 kinase-like domain-containing protein [Neoantrodia serialis]KAH9931378.1 kinase-like domain-containing protein [Neoantrodia serialis]
MSTSPAHSSISSSAGSVSGFPEEDLREGGRDNPGYFAARLGQRLERGRYCIVRKLGWGQYSSVWLARDRGQDSFVALKILTCEATKALSAGPDQRSDEQRMLEKIANADHAHRGYRHNLAYLNAFDIRGTHGLHRCLVTEALGYGVDYIRKLRDDNDRRVAPSIVKRVVRQVLLGLEYLHDVCGIVHTDLKNDNILFRPRDLCTIVAHELAENPSVTYDCGTEGNASVVPVVSQVLPLSVDASIHERDLDVVLADVGHSHWIEHHFQELIQPDALRAPEVILGHPWSTPADIWSVGCLVTEWLVGFWLFEPNRERLWSYEEDHLARMTEALDAQFEASTLENCKHRDKYFKQDGTFAHFTDHEEPTWPLRKLLESFSELGDEVDAAEAFLKRCLQLAPERRATAKELVDDPWLAAPAVSK